MGVNIYARKKISQNDKQEAIEMIKKNSFVMAMNKLMLMTKEHHIGKTYGRQRFKFAENPQLYDVNSLKSIKDFIFSGEYEFWDDYVDLTPEKLWEEFEKDQSLPAEIEYGNKVTREGINYRPGNSDDWF